MKKNHQTIGLILSFMFLAACNQAPFSKSEESKPEQKALPPAQSGGSSTDPDNSGDLGGSQPNFQIIKTAVFQDACFKCHTDATGNKGDVNLERYEDTKRALNDIKHDLEIDRMPRRRPPLDQNLKDLFFKWFELGAPE